MRIDHGVGPRRRLDVGRDQIGKPLLEGSEPAAELDRRPLHEGKPFDDQVEPLVVEAAQQRASTPDRLVLREPLGESRLG